MFILQSCLFHQALDILHVKDGNLPEDLSFLTLQVFHSLGIRLYSFYQFLKKTENVYNDVDSVRHKLSSIH